MPAVTPTQRALEEALAANPDDLAAHHAYADYLSDQGDPRGEFISVQLALEDPSRPAGERKHLQEREADLLRRHGRQWLGALAPYLLDQQGVHDFYLTIGRGFQFRFVRGWVEHLVLYELSGPVARAFRDNPLLRLPRHLVIREMDYDDPGWEDLMAAAHLGNLRAFQLGPEDDQCHMNGEHAVELVEKMPKLEELRLFAHRVDVRRLFALPLPYLRILYVYHLREYPLEVLAENPTLSNLTQLACWPHALEPDDEAAYITLEGVRALVRSPHLRSLTHLQLRLSDLGDEGCEEIVKSGILKRLRTLDIRGGRVAEAGARLLVACPDLCRLEHLDVTNNMISVEGIDALLASGLRPSSLEAGEQFDPDNADDEREYLWYGDCE
jgi:uncharacterized protein (TIGR02996 family)